MHSPTLLVNIRIEFGRHVSLRCLERLRKAVFELRVDVIGPGGQHLLAEGDRRPAIPSHERAFEPGALLDVFVGPGSDAEAVRGTSVLVIDDLGVRACNMQGAFRR